MANNEDTPVLSEAFLLTETGRLRSLDDLKKSGDLEVQDNPDRAGPFPVDLEKRAKMQKSKSKALLPDGFTSMDYSEFVTPPFPMEDLALSILRNPWVRSCIDAKVTNTFDLGYLLKKREGMSENPKEKKRFDDFISGRGVGNTPLIPELKQALMDFETTGNAFLEITESPKGYDGVYHVPSPRIRVGKKREKYVQRSSADSNKRRYFRAFPYPINYVNAGGETVYNKPPEPGDDFVSSLIHFKAYSPLDDFYGIPPILSAWYSMMGDFAAAKFNLQFFENNAVPQYIVTISGGKVTEEVKKIIRKFFEEKLQGQAHRTLILPLPGDMEAHFEPVAVEMKEGSFILYRKQTREETCAVMRVPPSEAGIWEQAIKANSQQQSLNFNLKTIRPLQRMFITALEPLFEAMGFTTYYLELIPGSHEDEKTLAQIEQLKSQAASVVVASGIMSVEEARKYYYGISTEETIESFPKVFNVGKSRESIMDALLQGVVVLRDRVIFDEMEENRR